MIGERLPNGVRARVDGHGDPWADAHRVALDNRHYLTDLDGFACHIVDSHDRIFAEYERAGIDGEYGLVAIFERKATYGTTEWNGAESAAFLRWLCRALGPRVQPVRPRFFYVFGLDRGPWDLQEIDIRTGAAKGQIRHLTELHWGPHWQELGLEASHRAIREWRGLA